MKNSGTNFLSNRLGGAIDIFHLPLLSVTAAAPGKQIRFPRLPENFHLARLINYSVTVRQKFKNRLSTVVLCPQINSHRAPLTEAQDIWHSHRPIDAFFRDE